MHYLGIDIGKKESNWFVVDDHGARVAKGCSATRPQDLGAVVDELMGLEEGVEVCVEAGNPTFGVAREMQARGADVFVVHPLDNALIAQSRKKTDGIDAKTLAHQRRLNILPPHRVHVPSEKLEDLRHLVTAREGLVDDRTALINRTLHVLARHGQWRPKRWLKHSSNWKRLRADLGSLRPADRLIVRHNINHALLLNEQIARFEKELRAALSSSFHREAELLRSIPGVGPISCASVVAWGLPMDRFPTARHFSSYAGLAPSTRQSGSRRVDGGTSGSGNRHLGRTLVQAALSFTQTGPGHELWRWYDRVRRKRGWKKARVALARKLAAVCYGVLTSDKPYDRRHVEVTLSGEAENG